MVIRAGELRHPVVIEKPSPTAGTMGGVTETWSTFSPWRVRIRPLSTRERSEFGQQLAEATHEIKGRYRPGITAHFRIRFGRRLFYLLGPPTNVGERSRELRCIVKETIEDS